MNHKEEKLKEWIESLSSNSLKRIIEVEFNDCWNIYPPLIV